jgi:hypothetical protein
MVNTLGIGPPYHQNFRAKFVATRPWAFAAAGIDFIAAARDLLAARIGDRETALVQRNGPGASGFIILACTVARACGFSAYFCLR